MSTAAQKLIIAAIRRAGGVPVAVAYLAAEACTTERHARRLLRDMEAGGTIYTIDKGINARRSYHIAAASLGQNAPSPGHYVPPPPGQNVPLGGDKMSPDDDDDSIIILSSSSDRAQIDAMLAPYPPADQFYFLAQLSKANQKSTISSLPRYLRAIIDNYYQAAAATVVAPPPPPAPSDMAVAVHFAPRPTAGCKAKSKNIRSGIREMYGHGRS